MKNNDTLITSLSESPEFYDQVLALIEKEFNYELPNHYDEDFNSLINPLNFQNCLFIVKDNTVISHAAFTNRKIIHKGEILPVTFLGGLVTKKEFQGKGLVTSIINKIITLNSNSGLFFLWSDLVNFYERFGFFKSGGTFETGKKIIEAHTPPDGFIKTSFPNINEDEFNDIQEIYQSNLSFYTTLVRNEHDWNNIKNNKSTELFIKKEKEKITSYFCQGKGKDLQNIIHEFGSINIKKELKHIDQFKLWLPETLISNYPNRELFYTAFIKIGNIEVLNNFLNKIILHFEILDFKNQVVSFTFEGKKFEVDSIDFLQLIFGPFPAEEFEDYKISFYISGLDSV